MKITEEDSLCFLPLRSNISNPAILFVFITAVREVWYQGLTCGSGCQSLSKYMSEQLHNSFFVLWILGDPGAATILFKSLETLPQCWFGYYKWSQCFKIRVAQHWGGRGNITVRTKVSGVKILRIFRKIQEKRCLFQRFVTSIVVGTSSRLAAPGPPSVF